jgi:hypothetical protein
VARALCGKKFEGDQIVTESSIRGFGIRGCKEVGASGWIKEPGACLQVSVRRRAMATVSMKIIMANVPNDSVTLTDL